MQIPPCTEGEPDPVLPSPGRSRQQPGRQGLESLPICRAGRAEQAEVRHICRRHPALPGARAGSCPSSRDPTKDPSSSHDPPIPEATPTPGCHQLLTHLSSNKEAEQETALPYWGKQVLSTHPTFPLPALWKGAQPQPHGQSRGQCHCFALGAGSCPALAGLLAAGSSCSDPPRGLWALWAEDGVLGLSPGARRVPGLCPPARWCPAASISERL